MSDRLRTGPHLTLGAARYVLSQAVAEAGRGGLNMSVAIVDGGGHLVCFEHMDRAPLISIEMSQAKAFTALAFRSNTDELAQYAQPGGVCYGMETAASRPLVLWGGGEPLAVGDDIVGAIGAGGGTPQEDAAIAAVGVAAFNALAVT